MSKTPVAFVYEFELEKDGVIVDRWFEKNLIPQDGLDQLSLAIFGDTTPIGTWYVGLFENNYLPAPGADAADLPGVIGEFVGYSEATRPLWQRIYDGAGTHTNEANRAAFTITQDRRLYGGFLVSASNKGGNTGLLLSVARFTTPRDVQAGMTFRVRATLSLVPTTLV